MVKMAATNRRRASSCQVGAVACTLLSTVGCVTQELVPWFQTAWRKLQALAWPLLARRTPSENAFLLLLPVVGLAVGFASVVTAHIISFLQNQFWGSGQNLLAAAEGNQWQLRLVIPLLGGLLVGVMGWFFRVKTRG